MKLKVGTRYVDTNGRQWACIDSEGELFRCVCARERTGCLTEDLTEEWFHADGVSDNGPHLSLRPGRQEPLDSDAEWARRNGWKWAGNGFEPAPFVRVVPNPVGEGWCPWVRPIGALQTEAPFGSARAALCVAEQIRQQRLFGINEMSCVE